MEENSPLFWWEKGCARILITIIKITAALTYVSGFTLLGIHSQDLIMALATPIGLGLAAIGSIISKYYSFQIKSEEDMLIKCNELISEIQTRFKSSYELDIIKTIDNKITQSLEPPAITGLCKWATPFLIFSIPSFGLLTGLASKGIILSLGFGNLYSISQIASLIAVITSSFAAFEVGANFIKDKVCTFNSIKFKTLKEICDSAGIKLIKSSDLNAFLQSKLSILECKNFDQYEVYMVAAIHERSKKHENEGVCKSLAQFLRYAINKNDDGKYNSLFGTEAKIKALEKLVLECKLEHKKEQNIITTNMITLTQKENNDILKVTTSENPPTNQYCNLSRFFHIDEEAPHAEIYNLSVVLSGENINKHDCVFDEKQL